MAIRSPTPTSRSTPCSTSRPSTYENRTSSASSFSFCGWAPVTSRSSGTCATPSSRASDGGAHLELVEDADDPVDRVDQHLHVERRGGDLGERHRALRVEPAAEQQRAAPSGAGRRSPCSGRTPCAGTACSARRRTTSAMSSSIWPTRSSPSPSASTVRAPSTVSVRVALICGVRRALAQVAVLGAGEVPPQPDHQRRDAEQARQRDPPADAERGGEGEHGGDDRDRPLGQRPAHRPAELVDVAAGAGEQVAGAGRLDDADRAARACCRRSPRAARPAPARRAPG